MTTTRRCGRGSVVMAMAVVGAAGLLATGCTGDGGGAPPVLGVAARLVSFDSCDGLLGWFHDEAGARVTAYGLDTASPFRGPVMMEGDSSASPSTAGASAPQNARASADSGVSTAEAGTQFSMTNVQEAGVGEPDLAVTDGNRLVSVIGGTLRVVDLTSAEPTVTATVALPAAGQVLVGAQLLVDGDHALVIGGGGGWYGPMEPTETGGGDMSSSISLSEARTTLIRIDLDGAPRVVGGIDVEADYVDARMVDGVVRVVTRSGPEQLGFVYPSGNDTASEAQALAANQDVVARSTIDDWLPSVTVSDADGNGEPRPAVDCAAVDHPEQFSGFDLVTVLGLDLRGGAVDPLPSAAVVAGAGTVYASTSTLYVTTERWPDPGTEPTPDDTAVPDIEAAGPHTDVHAFAIGGAGAAEYLASGRVRGTVLDQFSLSEHEGRLRIATTVSPTWWGWNGPTTREMRVPTTESYVTVLERDGEELRRIGEVGGLGRSEQIYSTRFVGDQAYVVTFRRTDPLYVVDLRDPAAPRVAGELKVNGYSSYLQLVGEGRLLGVGQDGTDTGQVTGFAQTLFDVSDPTAPTRLAQVTVPDATSLAEQDHHALLWWDATDTLVVPVEQVVPQALLAPAPGSSGVGWFSGVLVTKVTDQQITEVGRIQHPTASPTDAASGPATGSPGVPSGRVAPDCSTGASCIDTPVLAPSTAIERSLVVGDRLLTVSSAGVMVNDLADLTQRSWTPFA